MESILLRLLTVSSTLGLAGSHTTYVYLLKVSTLVKGKRPVFLNCDYFKGPVEERLHLALYASITA
ncbi:hypothetical protein GN958_ATG04490 [Phytophthora infestans]|uniref:Uncharacterized protein n=1 Tax=Phytophthora infestans TaxID=4787 RepID=A0A8S9V4B5_PHYIN|nr:hypothetical protein GN958_ATG04490 [Phytophthora infestans]